MDKMFHSQAPIVPHRVPYLVLPAPFCAPSPGFSFSRFTRFAISGKSDSKPDPTPAKDPRPKQKARPGRVEGGEVPRDRVDETDGTVRTTIPKKPRRGRPSEAALVEDFVRNTLDKTFESVRQTNPELFEAKRNVLKEKKLRSDESVDDEDDEEEEKEMAVEEDDPEWPVDAEVGWGVRASKYFEEYPIKNVVGEDGTVIDWDGESEAGYIGEINCLEWESFAYHPSPIIVLVFERYNRAADNWKALKELEKAAKVYWNAENILPPRTVKIDINIERDLAYALKVRDCPQILFLKGNRIVYREKEIRTSDELVQMIAHFYYNAKRPPWVEAASVVRRPF